MLWSTAGAIALWLVALAIEPVTSLSVVLLELFVALALANVPVAIVNRRYWPVQELVIWWSAERARLHPPASRVGREEGLAARVDTMILEGTGEPGTWGDIREEAPKLRPSVRREHALAMADLFETGEFDVARFQAALAELNDDRYRRYWRVRLALTEGFVRFVTGGDYLAPLLEVFSREGPFDLKPRRRLRLRMSRVALPVAYLAVGVAVALAVAVPHS